MRGIGCVTYMDIDQYTIVSENIFEKWVCTNRFIFESILCMLVVKPRNFFLFIKNKKIKKIEVVELLC